MGSLIQQERPEPQFTTSFMVGVGSLIQQGRPEPRFTVPLGETANWNFGAEALASEAPFKTGEEGEVAPVKRRKTLQGISFCPVCNRDVQAITRCERGVRIGVIFGDCFKTCNSISYCSI